jgi:hypothetical protein
MIFGSKKSWVPSTKKPSKVLFIGIWDEMNDLYKLDIVQTNTINLLDLLINNLLRKKFQPNYGTDI